jgi:hypothetical protein
MGMATNRYEERAMSAVGLGQNAQAKFENNSAVLNAGVLFVLPFLILQGLFKTKEVYKISSNAYYGLESIVITLAFMALMRIKTPEQLKQCKPGELGKLIGLDRVPQVQCLRKKIKELSEQNQTQNLNEILIKNWYEDNEEDGGFLYIDGHTRTYYGHKANLPVKYISNQKLCLEATTEFWVNDTKGMPVMMVIGKLTEKLQVAIEEYIIPELKKTILLKEKENLIPFVLQYGIPKPENKIPICTFVFDREAYEPMFFKRLFDEHNIAVITYRKNVKDKWPEADFKQVVVTTIETTKTMYLCEKMVELGGVYLREVRRLMDSGHQTAIITTNNVIKTPIIAGKMFTRWSQDHD